MEIGTFCSEMAGEAVWILVVLFQAEGIDPAGKLHQPNVECNAHTNEQINKMSEHLPAEEGNAGSTTGTTTGGEGILLDDQGTIPGHRHRLWIRLGLTGDY